MSAVGLRIGDVREVIAGGLFLSFAVTGLVLASDYPLGTAMRMGAGYFPMLVAAALGGLGVALLLRGLTLQALPGESERLLQWRPSLLIGGSMLVFAWLLPTLGLALATLLMTVLSGLARQRARLSELALLGGALGLFSVVVFAYGLGLNLPLLPA
ncbi:tripartite tricarboxylate transporter TctB family protein [Pseudomonas sichuanensis]|uniref:tripartite tricarboxylate transporter TctB family protein n=1 Tax=Pseudomonas TaxID=286 RepID=UPI0037FA3380